jgi:hypothetical protein
MYSEARKVMSSVKKYKNTAISIASGEWDILPVLKNSYIKKLKKQRNIIGPMR